MLLFFLFGVQSRAQKNFPFDFAISSWTHDHGLPQNSVRNIVQTKDGYIWLTTFGGLARFDGIKFTVFNRFNSPGLVSDRIMSLFADNEGGLWISTEKGLSYYKNGLFKTYDEKDGFQMFGYIQVMQDKKGTVWAFSIPVFYKFQNGRFDKVDIIDDESLRSKIYDGGADFFVPSGNSIYALIDDQVINFIKNFEQPFRRFVDVIEQPKGTIWATSYFGGLYRFQRNEVRRFTTKDGLTSDFLRGLYVDKEGVIWVAGFGGLNLIYDNKIYSTALKGSPQDEYTSIVQDNEENYWIGTERGGIIQLRKTIISNYGKNEGLDNEGILSLCVRKNGTLLIGTSIGVYELRNNTIRRSPLSKVINQKYIWSIFEDSKGRIWSVANDLSYVDEKGKLAHTQTGQHKFYEIDAIYEDRSGAIWVGYHDGLIRYYNNILTRYSTEQGLSDNDVRSILEDDKGNIWVGTINGLNKISRGKVEAVTIPGLRNNYMRAIYQDGDGILWFGTYGGGLIRYKENKFFIFTTDNGLFDNVVSQIVEDDNGYFWMGCNRGIQRISRRELNDFADGKKTSYFVQTYDKYDGMISSETNGGFQPSAVKDSRGNIYFPTIEGLTVVNTNIIKKNNKVPPVNIEKVLVAGKERDFSNLQINYDSSNVDIYFSVLSYTAPLKIHSKYIMEGYDKGWNDAGNLRYARYLNLPPGEYTFKVIASNNDNVWNEKGVSIAVTVLPPFWMTWWFRSILIVMFLSIGPIIYFRKVRALKKEHNRQHEFSQQLIENQETERKRIASELHDSLGQSILVMKNRALIALQQADAEQVNLSNMVDQVKEISTGAENALEEVRTIAHNLRPVHLERFGITDTLNAAMEHISASSEIEWEWDIEQIDGLIPQKDEINLFRIIQEAMNNIIKHSNAKKAGVRVVNNDSVCKIHINDDGKGFDLNSAKNKNGLGLSGIGERTKLIGASYTFETSSGHGTKLTITIPLR